MQAHSVLAHATPRRMTRGEYDGLVAQGMFAEERAKGGPLRARAGYSVGESLAPAAFPDLTLAVGDLFVHP